MSKKQIRINCIEKRSLLGSAYIREKSEAAVRKVLCSYEFMNAESILAYKNTQYEVNTEQIIKEALCDKKTTLVPVLTSRNEMKCAIIDQNTVYIKNKYNIYEPAEISVYTKDIDLIICPGLCFDEQFNRLGYGKGFFDRFLKKHKNVVKIGLCLDEFLVKEIPYEVHDIKMDIIITQSRIIKQNK